MTPTVSVVVPVFNGERFVEEALDSVRAQSSPPLEVIVVDDGSTDGTAGILSSRADIRALATPNRGPSAARNLGVADSSGECIAFLDADDVWEPGRLATQLGLLAEHPDAGLALCHMRYLVHERVPAWFNRDPAATDQCFVPSGWLVRRSAWDVVGPFDEALRVSEDVDWYARAKDLGIGRVVAPEALVWRRLHDRNLSARPLSSTLIGPLRASIRRQRARDEAMGE